MFQGSGSITDHMAPLLDSTTVSHLFDTLTIQSMSSLWGPLWVSWWRVGFIAQGLWVLSSGTAIFLCRIASLGKMWNLDLPRVNIYRYLLRIGTFCAVVVSTCTWV